MPLLTKPPEPAERTVRGWTRTETIEQARLNIERSWRMLVRSDDADDFITELGMLPARSLLTPADVADLVAYARMLGSATKTSVYTANYVVAQSFIRTNARSLSETQIRARLLELGLDDDDRSQFIALAAKLRSDPSLVL